MRLSVFLPDSNRHIGLQAAHENSRNAKSLAVRSNRCRKQGHLLYQYRTRPVFFPDTQFGRRMTGTGPRAEQNHQTFTRRFGLDGHLRSFDFSNFRPPRIEGQQMRLF
jgi:hypothetical protein